MKRIFLIVSASVWIVPAAFCMAQTSLGWPEVIDRLKKERTQAETCAGLIKSGVDKAAIDSAKTTYGLAKADMDGVIAGLTVVLFDGGKPENLPTVRDSLDASGKALTQICDAAVKTTKPNTKGVWEEIAKGAVEPLIKAISDGVAGLWAWKVDKDKLALETKKTELEAAKWPEFENIAAR